MIGLIAGYVFPACAMNGDIPPTAIPLSAPLVTTAYIPLLPFGADNDILPQYIPIGSNLPLSGDHQTIKRAVIIIHDQTRDASAWINMTKTLAGGNNGDLLLLAPQFLLEADIVRFSRLLPDHGKMFARWSINGLSSPWEDGGDSLAVPHSKGISSFTAVDLLIYYLSDKQRFPSLQQIILTGHGTGGDFVQRYAAVGLAPDILDSQHISLRYVVANPSSYLYFTALRPQKDKHGFFPPDAKTCPEYNNYKYGLENLNSYAHRLGVNAIKLRYASRNIVYLLGENIVTQDTTLDDSCAAQLQGPNRLLRAENYSLYLNLLFGDNESNQQTFVKVPKIGFDPTALFSSRCGMNALFGDGVCE